MKAFFASLALTLAAYSDTVMGFMMRAYMTKPVGFFQEDLAAYITLFVHY